MTEKRSALVTGVTGQDGAYLVDLLICKGYRVHGVSRHASAFDFSRLQISGAAGTASLHLHDIDLTDSAGLKELVEQIAPDEVYNLAAQSHVPTSIAEPALTEAINADAPIALMQAVLDLGHGEDCRIFQASTAELFGDAKGRRIDESMRMEPRNPYAHAKHRGYLAARRMREEFGLFVVNGFLFNHESPYRSPSFVTRKITLAVAAHACGAREPLRLGNLDARRDWGHARDYVEGMWRSLQRDVPDDYVFATGENHSVREFVELAFAAAGRKIRWEGAGADEIGLDAGTGDRLVEVDPSYFRTGEVHAPTGDAAKARKELEWAPRTGFQDLVRQMVLSDMDANKEGCAS